MTDLDAILAAGGPWKRAVRIGGQVLIEGDCREVMAVLPKVDAVVTDPPYGIDQTHANHLSKITLRDGTPAGQALSFKGICGADLVVLASEWVKAARRWVVFTCEWKHAHLLDEAGLLIRFGIWRKPDGAPQFTGDRPGTGWEAVAICHRAGRKRWNGGGKHAVWTFAKGKGNGHPTQKPLPFSEALICDFTDAGEFILDPFMGSGTTLVACQRLGRQGIGIELDPGYFDIACKRVQEVVDRPPLFAPEPPKPVQEPLL